MTDTGNALAFLKDEMENKEKRTIMSFEEFLEAVRLEPERVLRNIFQLFYDMVTSYVGEGKDEYPGDPESIGFVRYDCSRLFIKGMDNPFFADRLFANRFIRQVGELRRGAQQNRIYVFEGPPGCGKSTFLNNLIRKFEEYTETREGQSLEIFWEIDESLFPPKVGKDCANAPTQKIEISCPSHDHPILIIPKNYRPDFLDKLLSEKMTEVKHKLSEEKEYEWIFKDEACTICKSLFWALFDKLGSLDKVLAMVKARPYKFDRRLGEGISVFNPGDKPMKETCLTDKQIQDKLDQLFGANLVKYVFSRQAKTNGGIYVLMDIKSYNTERLLELHNVISEGVHKVDVVEERINSLFLALMNPEDKEAVDSEKTKSFQARIQYSKIPYVLEPLTEVNIYRSIFGDHINARFFPLVLENFAKLIISSRMNTKKNQKDWINPINDWIKDFTGYKQHCDENGLLLRMQIYSGIIPLWLSDGDKKKFTAPLRRKLIAEAENEGKRGFSGRDSIRLFGEFFARYGPGSNLINMDNVVDYFRKEMAKDGRNEYIPDNFIGSLVNWYDYEVLSEVKEALYFYNKKKIQEDVLNYLCAVNYDPGSTPRCKYTGQEVEVTVEFLKIIGSYITGEQLSDQGARDFASGIQRKYVEIVAQDPSKEITETELYQGIFEAYVKNLKEKVLQPFVKNDNFREVVKFFGAEEFKTFDTRLKEHVTHMIENLVGKFGYTKQGAKEICLYVIDRKLVEKFEKSSSR